MFWLAPDTAALVSVPRTDTNSVRSRFVAFRAFTDFSLAELSHEDHQLEPSVAGAWTWGGGLGHRINSS